jgi:NarL family two-component system response regulator LiaR
MTASPAPRIRVLIVDDHPMVRRGLATFLRIFDDLELAGEVAGGQEAVQLCDQVRPDVVLMDMVMPDMDGATATRLIRRQSESIRVIALTSFKDEILVQSALQAGAIGYLPKDVSAEELARAIHAAAAGRATLSPDVAEVIVHDAGRPPKPGLDLTERERTVLALMVEGLNNTQIAEKVGASPSTIKSNVSNILTKPGVSSRTEALTLALRNQLVP